MALNNPNWSYLRNVFNNVTSNNNKRMYIMATDHRDKLFEKSTTLPEINTLYLLMQPDYELFSQAYSKVTQDFNAYKAATFEFETHISALSSTHIQNWDISIQYLMPGNASAYKMLLPKGRTPFQSGAYDERVKAVRDLADVMVAYPALSTLLTDVEAFRDVLTAARVAQQGKETTDTLSRQALEVARENLAITMHRIFGHLIALYADQPAIIEAYYELKYLKAPIPKENSNPPIEIQPNSRQQIMDDTFATDANITIENTGDTQLGVYLTSNELAQTPDTLVVVQPKTKQTYAYAELIDGTPHPTKLIAVNLTQRKGYCKAAFAQLE